MSLLVIGATVVDLIVTNAPRLPRWPRHSEFTSDNLVLLKDAPLVTLGGNGANAAYVAACDGAEVHLCTRLGRDAFGEMVRGWMAKVRCQVLPGGEIPRTSVNITAANVAHSRATFFYPPPAPLLPKSKDLSADLTHVLACGWPHPPFPQLEKTFRSLRRKGLFTALDAGPILGKPWSLKSLQPVLDSLDLLLTNEYEINTITRNVDLALSLKKLRRGFAGHVVVKRGRRGALWLPAGSSKTCAIKPQQIRAINTVGAGDSFNGALMGALSLKMDFPAALAEATKIAAAVVASHEGVLGARKREG